MVMDSKSITLSIELRGRATQIILEEGRLVYFELEEYSGLMVILLAVPASHASGR